LYLDHYPCMEWTLYPKPYQLFFWGISFVQCLNDPILTFHTQILCTSCFPTPLKFRHQLASFDSILMQVFERLLNPCYFECLKVLLVCWHVSLPVFSGKISFIFAKTIVLIVYLGNWVLIMLIIVFRFLLDSCMFLLGYWGELFGFATLLGALEVLSKVSSLSYDNMFTPIWITCREGNCKTIPFPTSFLTCLLTRTNLNHVQGLAWKLDYLLTLSFHVFICLQMFFLVCCGPY